MSCLVFISSKLQLIQLKYNTKQERINNHCSWTTHPLSSGPRHLFPSYIQYDRQLMLSLSTIRTPLRKPPSQFTTSDVFLFHLSLFFFLSNIPATSSAHLYKSSPAHLSIQHHIHLTKLQRRKRVIVFSYM